MITRKSYKVLTENEISLELFQYFLRHQIVTNCWRRNNGKWTVRYAPFIDDWTEENYLELVAALRETVHSGGLVYSAFCDRQLKGFASVTSEFFGTSKQYLDLTNIYVSEDKRNCGIGKNLFTFAKIWAKEHGAKKLYISAHSAVESQKFYKSLGCVEAKEYSQEHVEKEPFDCQLECVL